MRLFIALNLPKKERQRIHRAARLLREGDLPVRWVELDNYHITLKFLGEVRPERVSEVEAALSNVGASTQPFALGLGGFGAFPTVRKPRVIWLGVNATPELRCLKQDIEWSLSDTGFEPETRAFHPHLTLGRADATDGAGAFRGLDDTMAGMQFECAVPVRTIDLMRSHVSREGARYSVLSSARLAGS